MPRPGQKSITLPEQLYEEIKKLAKERGTTPPKLLRDIIQGRPVEGQGSATASPPRTHVRRNEVAKEATKDPEEVVASILGVELDGEEIRGQTG